MGECTRVGVGGLATFMEREQVEGDPQPANDGSDGFRRRPRV
jgi:hypothetical protein